jgi:hypothetical protein
MMRQLVGHTSEHKPPDAAHAQVAYNDEVGIDCLCDSDQTIGGSTIDDVRMKDHAFVLGLGDDSGKRLVTLFTKIGPSDRDPVGIDELRPEYGRGNCMNHM